MLGFILPEICWFISLTLKWKNYHEMLNFSAFPNWNRKTKKEQTRIWLLKASKHKRKRKEKRMTGNWKGLIQPSGRKKMKRGLLIIPYQFHNLFLLMAWCLIFHSTLSLQSNTARMLVSVFLQRREASRQGELAGSNKWTRTLCVQRASFRIFKAKKLLCNRRLSSQNKFISFIFSSLHLLLFDPFSSH